MLEVFWKNLGWFDFTDRYIDIFGGQPFLYELKSGELKLLRKATEDEKNVECDWEWNPQFEFLPAAFRVVISKYPEAKEAL